MIRKVRVTANSRWRGVFIWILGVLACLLFSESHLYAQPVRTQHLTVELVTETGTIAPNHDFLAGLHFVLDKGWHIYWINAGDAGEPPRVDWRLPNGITAGALQFPAPQRLPLGPLMDFGYEKEVLLPVPMRADASAKPGPKETLRGHLHFLVCSSVCVPGQAQLEHTVLVAAQPATADPKTEPLFLMTERHLPRSLPAGASVSVAQTKTEFVVTLETGERIASAEFYPLDQNIVSNAAPQTVTPLVNGIRISIPKVEGLQHVPTQLRGLIKLPRGTSYQFMSPVTIAAVPIERPTNGTSMWRALGTAFLGGLILNLMPCVFPVLFIKGLSLVQSSGEERKRLRSHGAMYTLGILASFWIIVAVLLLLRAGGKHLGWGFQFQSPYFVAVMALLFFFLGLSLAGQFEIGLSATSLGGGLARRGGYSGSFFTGVLATVVATPCTAPFMGAAIGFALAQSVAVTFAVFTLLALGLAAPYVLLTLQPAWTRLLPKPGVWMEYLKQAVSIPIFIAVIWMVWVFAQVVGGNGVAALLAGILVTAIAGWVLGHWPAKWPAIIIAILLLIFAVALPSVAARQFRASTSPTNETSGSNIAWQPFSPRKLADDRARDKAVFVDFSAAWCLSCQVNERAVLDRTDVEAAFRKRGVVTMRADWTNHDDTITEALTQLGRSGVPTYALYSGIPDSPLAIFVVYAGLVQSWSYYSMVKDLPKTNPMYGIWHVDQFMLAGTEHPPLTTDNERWEYIIFDYKAYATIQDMQGVPLRNSEGAPIRFASVMNTKGKTLTLKNPANSTWKFEATYDRGQPDRMTMDGQWNGKTLHLALRKMHPSFFLSTRGLHWVNDRAINR